MLTCRGVSHRFGSELVLQDIELDLRPTDRLAILGQSGSGKTTLLRIFSGELSPSSGSVSWNEKDVRHLPPIERGVLYLSQSPRLFPHLNVRDNVAFGLKARGRPRSEARDVAETLLGTMGLSLHADKRPATLSGGQQQRVAFARAIAVAPKVLLLDEPFGALDWASRHDMHRFLLDLTSQYPFAFALVTHDPYEALRLGDRYALVVNGNLVTYASREAFVFDERTGIRQEQEFWNQL